MKFRRDDLLGLWALLWRVALFGTVLFPVGIALLVVLLGFLIAPPIYAVARLIDGQFLVGFVVGLCWLLCLRVSRRVLGGFFEGFQHASL